MTFYEELKEFFLKHDRDRLYMAKSIAGKFKKKSQQKVVMRRLDIIYKNGGPANIELAEKNESPTFEAAVEEMVDIVETPEIETESIESTPQDIVIESEDDDEVKGDA